mmetsp:Transcript_77200/g.121474  ORF Transcript_77200/g.121474 Transcript_77200/m.121474 type:complete len:699 (-) Transcript_77200:328-2424(-)
MHLTYLRLAIYVFGFHGHFVSCELVDHSQSKRALKRLRHLNEREVELDPRKSSEGEMRKSSESKALGDEDRKPSESKPSAPADSDNSKSSSAAQSSKPESRTESKTGTRNEKGGEQTTRNDPSSSSTSSPSLASETRKAKEEMPDEKEGSQAARKESSSSSPSPSPVLERSEQTRNDKEGVRNVKESEQTTGKDASSISSSPSPALGRKEELRKQNTGIQNERNGEQAMEEDPSSSSSSPSSPALEREEKMRNEGEAMGNEKQGEQPTRKNPSSSSFSPSPASEREKDTRKENAAMQNEREGEQATGKDPLSYASSQSAATTPSSPLISLSSEKERKEYGNGEKPFATERIEKSRVDGELTVATVNAADIASDDTLIGPLSVAIANVAGTQHSVSITRIEPFRRLRSARRNIEQQRLRIGFSIDTANRQEADDISSNLKSTSKSLWTAQIGAEIAKTQPSYSMVVLEVSAALADMSVSQTRASNDDGFSELAVLIIVLASILVLFAIVVACFVCLRIHHTMSPTNTRLKVAETPAVTHVVTKQVKPTVTTASKPVTLQRAWSDVSTDASSNMSRSGESFFTVSSSKSDAKTAPQKSLYQTTTSCTQQKVAEPLALVAQSATISRAMQQQRMTVQARRNDIVAFAPRSAHSLAAATAKDDVFLSPRVAASSLSITPQMNSLHRGLAAWSRSGPPAVQRR